MRKKKSRYLNSVALASALSLFAPVSSYSQQNTAGIQDRATDGDAVPSLQFSSAIILPDGRNIPIYKGSTKKGDEYGNIFFHRPIFALEKATQGTDSPIIHDKIEFDGSVYISLRVILSDPRIREIAAASVLDRDIEIKKKIPQVRADEIDVRPWPLKVLKLSAVHSLTGYIYGESIQESLRTSGDAIQISIKIPSSNYEAFLEALKTNRIKFSPSYTYENDIVVYAQMASEIAATVSAEIQQILSSQQKSGTSEPIFQRDANILNEKLVSAFSQSIRGNDPSLLSHMAAININDLILRPEIIKFEDLNSNKELLAKVAEYLSPIVDTMIQTTKTEDRNKETDVTTKNKKISPGFDKDGFNATGELSENNVKTLEKEHKVNFDAVDTSNVLKPHSIEVNYIREAWQDNLTKLFQSVYFSVGTDRSFTTDYSFGADFTADKLENVIGENQIEADSFAGVPKGVALCSFRNDLPTGFVLLDGQESKTWPVENWVSVELRGSPLPNLKGAFAKGATSNDEVGRQRAGGSITLPEHNINGDSLSLQVEGMGGVLDAFGQLLTIDNQFNMGNPRPVKVNTLPITVAGDHISVITGSGFLSIGESVLAKTAPHISSVAKKIFTGVLEGEYKIPEYKFPLSKPEFQPPSFGCQWIMRIK